MREALLQPTPDWRLPAVAELESILDYGIAPPPVDVAFDGVQCGAACTDLTDPACSCTTGAAGIGYSTAVSAQLAPGSAWAARFDTGPVYSFAKDGAFFARAVRGGSVPPVPRFSHNPDGTVSDAETNLMWEPKVERNGVANAANPHDADNLYAWTGSCSLAPATLCQPDAAAAAACAAGVEGDPTGCGECGAGDPAILEHMKRLGALARSRPQPRGVFRFRTIRRRGRSARWSSRQPLPRRPGRWRAGSATPG